MKLSIGVMSAIFVLLISVSGEASTVAFGSLADSTGDNNLSVSDITSLSLTVDSAKTILFSARFAPGTFASSNYTAIVLDTDQNPATGFSGIDSSHNDASLIGSEFLVNVWGSGFQANAQLYVTATSSFTLTYPVLYLSNGFDVVVPLSDLGNDDGFINFKGLVSRHFTAGNFTPIGDYISDIGSPAGTTVAVAPETNSLTLLALSVVSTIALLGHRRIKGLVNQ